MIPIPILYIIAGINEGVSFIMTTLLEIPEMLRDYHARNGLPEPTTADIQMFAQKQGRNWVNMHASCYKDVFFPFLHETGIVDQHVGDYLLRAPRLADKYLSIQDNPLTNKPAIAYDTGIMDGDQQAHVFRLYSEVSAGRRTKCPAFEAGITTPLYEHVLETMTTAGVLGY